jgi:putative ABC transport system permease protein
MPEPLGNLALFTLARDFRAAVRVSMKRPGVSLAVVLTLALGLGANTAVFSLINSIVLRPLPYPDSGRLYTLFEQDSLGSGRRLASYPTFLDWQEQHDVFGGLAFIHGTGLAYQTGDESGLFLSGFVSDQFFPTLGVPALLGRVLGPDDYLSGNANVVVLSHHTWRSSFGGDSGVIGRTVTLANQPFVVVGVMPPTFAYPVWGMTANDLWLPLPALPPPDLTALRQRGFHADSRIVARLRSDVSVARAQEQMDAIARRLVAVYPEAGVRWTKVGIVSLAEFTVGNMSTRLLMLGAAVALVLLICGVNLANLYLAQSAARTQEFAIRAALGAARARVLRQLLTEALVVASAGGGLGLLLAVWTMHLIRAGDTARLPRAGEIGLDWRVLAFALALTALTALLFAAVTVRCVASPHLAPSLGERGGTALSRGGRGRLPAWLLSGQVALTVVLLIGAALLTQSFWRLSEVDPGFDPDRLVGVRIMPPSPAYDDAEAAVRLYDRIAESVSAVPGVTNVALINHTPLSSGGLPTPAAIGHAPTGGRDDFNVLYETVSAEYFAMMDIPVVGGREFSVTDVNGPPGPVIVNQTLARRWSGRSPVGERLGVLKAARTRPDFGEPLIGTVVGVVGDVKHFGLDTEPPPTVYVPYTHNPWAMMVVVVRTGIAPEPLIAPIERAVRQVDPAIPLKGPGLGASTFETSVRNSYAPQRLTAALVSAFATVALLLAAVGIFGVMSYTVALETREIGIRMALGAAPPSVLRAVVGRVTRIAGLGLVAGMAAALGLSRLITGFLYDVRPTDPVTFLGVGVLLLVVAMVAGFFPARRAAAVDPVVALRQSP